MIRYPQRRSNRSLQSQLTQYHFGDNFQEGRIWHSHNVENFIHCPVQNKQQPFVYDSIILSETIKVSKGMVDKMLLNLAAQNIENSYQFIGGL